MHRFHFSSVLKRMSTIVEAEGDAGSRWVAASYCTQSSLACFEVGMQVPCLSMIVEAEGDAGSRCLGCRLPCMIVPTCWCCV